MLLPASQEYIELCQSQVQLLMQGLSASEIAVYLTEQLEMTGDASLKPLVVYPGMTEVWPQNIQWQLESVPGPAKILAPAKNSFDQTFDTSGFIEPINASTDKTLEPNAPNIENNQDKERFQLLFPLKHDNAVLGILMIARRGSSWSEQERIHGEQVAKSLSLACVLDQRSQWLTRTSYDKQALLVEEHQRLGKLLHQFRNPLTALRTLGKLMVRRMTNQDPNAKFAQSIVDQSDRLELMLREFSQTLNLGEKAFEDLTDPESSLMPSPEVSLLPSAGVISGGDLNLQVCWIQEIIAPVLAANTGRLEEKKLQLHTDINNELPPITGDSAALNEIFSNLIDNAIKYTPEGGFIEVLIKESYDKKSGIKFQDIYISDSGYGIPSQDLEKIFAGKYRGIQAQSNIPGTGLGLSIVKELILKMGGMIQAISPAHSSESLRTINPDKQFPGSTFLVSFPVKTPTPNNVL